MMKKYSFVRPSVQRYKSPEIRNNLFYIKNRIIDANNHYFDLEKAKRKLFSKHIQRKRLPNKESEVSILLSESPFVK